MSGPTEGPVPYTRETVCTPDMVRIGLQLSERQWARKRHLLPWSYAFGDRCPRITWGQVLAVIESGALQLESTRHSSHRSVA